MTAPGLGPLWGQTDHLSGGRHEYGMWHRYVSPERTEALCGKRANRGGMQWTRYAPGAGLTLRYGGPGGVCGACSRIEQAMCAATAEAAERVAAFLTARSRLAWEVIEVATPDWVDEATTRELTCSDLRTLLAALGQEA